MSSTPPDEILDSVKLIQRLKAKSLLSREERENLNRAKLHIAYWACRSENIIASRENLAYVLGPDAADIMNAYDKYLVSAKDKDRLEKEKREKQARKKDDTKFWGGAS